MSAPAACTIVSNNYLAFARVFSRSFLARHPGGRVFVLFVDRPHPAISSAAEPFESLFAEELRIPGFLNLAFRYSILELNTAVKPYLLAHLHRQLGLPAICYFDPDILVTGDLTPLYARLEVADALLTPHLTAPLADAGIPSERDILLSGVYNLGFLGLAFNARTLAFLEWWQNRLHEDCRHQVERGLFVDQRWMDLAPALLPRAEVLHDPGCNMAYWNLSHRRLEGEDGGWRVCQEDRPVPLRFYHFSGFDPRRPGEISKYQNRFTLGERPDLAPLYREYTRQLLAAGYEEHREIPYAYDRFDDGTPIRPAFRTGLGLVDPEGRRWPDPFATAGGSYLGWLHRPVTVAPLRQLTRAALLAWDLDPALQLRFPHPAGDDFAAFSDFAGRLAAGNAPAPLPGDLSFGEPLPAEQLAWLTADAGYEPERRPRIPRLALLLHQRRADLARAFPEPLGRSRVDFAYWFVTSGRVEHDLAPELVEPVLRSLGLYRQLRFRVWWWRQRSATAPAAAAAAPPAAALPAGPAAAGVAPSGSPGINVVGWAAAATGVGEACRGTLAALRAAGIEHAVWPLSERPWDEARSVGEDAGRQGLPYEVSLYHVNADMTETVDRWMPQSLSRGRYRIGYWFWELAHFPLRFADSFRRLDEVWAPSRFCLEAFAALCPCELRWVPPCVVAPREPALDRRAAGLPAEAFLFVHLFDGLSVAERKNPWGLLDAFEQAVRQSPRPLHLLLKLGHAAGFPQLVRDLERRCQALPVTLWTHPLSRPEIDAVLAAADAYVALHRSEGLGLPLIESLYLEKPVIATGYGGVTDFFDATTGFPVASRPIALDRPHGPYPEGAVWADPDLADATRQLLAVAADPAAAAARAAQGRERVRQLYSPAAAGERFRRELARIESGR